MKEFFYSKDLHQHMRSIHQGITYTCDTCQKEFKSQRNLNIHIENVHKNENPKHENNAKHKCDMCSNFYSLERNLKRHIRENHYEMKPINL